MSDPLRTAEENLPADETPVRRCSSKGELARLRQLLAQAEAELSVARQQQLVLGSFVASVQRSWSWRLFAPMRALRWLVAPRGFDESALIPWRDLKWVARSGTWRAIGDHPQFVVPCFFPAGWLRVRYALSTDTPSRVQIYADTGNGFTEGDRIEEVAVERSITRDLFIRVDRSVRAVRIDPLDGKGLFQLTGLSVESVPAPAALGHALLAKVRLLLHYRCLLPSLGRGLRLLLRGRLGRFWANLHKSLGLSAPRATFDPADAYRRWRRQHGLDDAGRAALQAQDASLVDPPRFSLLVPVRGLSASFRQALASILGQTYPHWELCVADAGGTVGTVLAEAARGEARVRYVPLAADAGPVALANAALDLASGDYVALLDPADQLARHALSRVAQLLAADRDLDLVYTDEDRLDLEGQHSEPFFKPDWSPDYLLSWHYTGGLSVYRAALMRELGAFRAGLDGAEAYDLTLRVAARTRRVGHVADVLYHARSSPSATVQAQEAARQALRDHLGETGRPGNVEPGPGPGLHRVRFALVGSPRVSIVIPTTCAAARRPGRASSAIVACVQSIRWMTAYASYEILVLNPGAIPDALRCELDGYGVRHLTDTAGGSNRAAILNLGAAHATGAHLVFLDEALEVVTPDWLECLLEYSQQADVGAVGAKLLFPDKCRRSTCPHGKCRRSTCGDGRVPSGCGARHEGNPGHGFRGYPVDPGSMTTLAVARNASAVTGACLMTRAEVFRAAGGFTEAFPRCCYDVDYCLKVQEAARRVVVTPYAQLSHPDPVAPPAFSTEQEAFLARWGPQATRDPFSNPHLADYAGG